MRGRIVVFTLFTAAYFLSYFYRTANAVIAPDLVHAMGLNAAQLGLMTSLFFAAFAVVQIPLGIGLDRWGPRWVTPGLMFVAAGGSLVFAAAPSYAWLALGRVLIGMGMAGVLMGSLKIFSQWFTYERFATVSGLLVGIGSFGALFAATPLAWLNASLGWRQVFVVSAAVTVGVAGAIMFWTRNTPPGVPWTGGQPDQGRVADVFRAHRFWRMAPLTFFLAGTMLGFQSLWAGPYIYDVLGLDEVQTGNFLMLMGIGATVGYLASGWLADRFGLARVLVMVSACFILAQVGLALQPSPRFIALLYLVFGFTGAFNVMLVAQARQLFPLSMTGKAVTAINVFAIGGTFLVQWWMGLIIARFPVDDAGRYPPAAYSAALAFTAVGALAALVWYAPLARHP